MQAISAVNPGTSRNIGDRSNRRQPLPHGTDGSSLEHVSPYARRCSQAEGCGFKSHRPLLMNGPHGVECNRCPGNEFRTPTFRMRAAARRPSACTENRLGGQM